MAKIPDLDKQIRHQLLAEAARNVDNASQHDFWMALGRTFIAYIAEDWEQTKQKYQNGKQAHYFSAEFLEGRSLLNNLVNTGVFEDVRDTLSEMGQDLAEITEVEIDPGLGNGGLGRLAACFLDSCATKNLPVTGYGILYRYGLFRQEIENGFQKEYPDAWMEEGYPFIIRREEERELVHYEDMDVYAVPYDLPITGYGTKNVNTLRLWKAEPAQEFDFNLFNSQRFDDAVIERNRVNDIYRVLYPNDSSYDGKVLRVRQQYFFVSASLQSLVKQFERIHGNDWARFSDFHTIQLNDTHPVIGILELMRILTDEKKLDWDTAWKVTQNTFAYTNHTILAEAYEKWEVGIFQFLFPHLLDILYRINEMYRLEAAAAGFNSHEVDETAPFGSGRIRMAWLACYGSFSINGVAAMHTSILKNETLRQFYRLWPEKFSNKTNGVTPRRWLRMSNPALAGFLTERLGSDAWVTDLSQLRKLENDKNDEALMNRLLEIKHANKVALAKFIKETEGITVNPNSIFDIQIKRLHEYKRQLLNALLILDDYFMLKANPKADYTPRVCIFGAKAAPGYFRAKAIIKFINEIARLVNNDPAIGDRLKVVFLHNYNVSRAERLFSAADISEQISTAGMEASGTGNMKFMLNGAITLGTLDGANVEILEEVGAENCYIFGCRANDMQATREYYNPQWQYYNIPGLKRCIDTLIDGTFSDRGSGMFSDLYNSLLNGTNWERADVFYVLGDFDDYRKTHRLIEKDYRNKAEWARKCWTNIVRSGRFSSDRTISEYAAEIWRVLETPIA